MAFLRQICIVAALSDCEILSTRPSRSFGSQLSTLYRLCPGTVLQKSGFVSKHRSTGRYEKEVKAKGARNFRFNRSPPGRNMRRIESNRADLFRRIQGRSPRLSFAARHQRGLAGKSSRSKLCCTAVYYSRHRQRLPIVGS